MSTSAETPPRAAPPLAATAAAHHTAHSEVTAALASDASWGLTTDEARQRVAATGANVLEPAEEDGPAKMLLRQLTSPILILLIAAGVLSAALGDFAEAAVIFAVVVLNAGIGFRQEYAAVRAMEALRAMAAPTATAIRSGAAVEVRATTLAPGDVVLLEPGSRIAADGRLLEAESLRTDESALTGESAPVDKHVEAVAMATPLAERTSMAYAGTAVSGGRGRMVVTATGMVTELGQVAGLLHGADANQTPLQLRLATLVRQLSLAALVIVLIVALLGLLRGDPLDLLLLTAVSLAVAAVPESLPAVVTITLGLGARRMLARRTLIRRLYAVETLGSVTTICSDKTGTLTQNQMTLVALDTSSSHLVVGAEEHSSEELQHRPTLRLLLIAGTLCNDTVVAGDGELLGDPTETALVAAAQRYGFSKRNVEAILPRESERPFDSDRKRMTTVHRLAQHPSDADDALGGSVVELDERLLSGGRLSFTKGAVDGLLPCCDQVRVDGRPAALGDDERGRIIAAGDELASRGLRVLGLASREWSSASAVPEGEALESGLTFIGLVGMIDPARPEARAAIETCREAGMRAIMITGDHPLTAGAIGLDLGLVTESPSRVVTGAELERLDETQLAETVRATAIYARVSPADKLRIVAALQRQGEVVAMTGDGVNDAPALKQADVGVAMGITGTDVTKDAADMILLDDDFATIVEAVREGRVVFDNVRKFIRNILSGNVAEVAAMVIAPLVGMPIPLLPLQILWLNLVTDGLPAMAMSVERPEPGVMARPPTPLQASLLGADRGRRILSRGAALTALTLVPTYLLWHGGDDAWRTVFFTAIAFAELAGGFAMRSEATALWRLGLFSNRAMVGAVGLTIALQVLLVAVPVARSLFDLVPLDAAHWLLVVAIATSYLAYVEFEKRMTSWRGSRRTNTR